MSAVRRFAEAHALGTFNKIEKDETPGGGLDLQFASLNRLWRF
jgi:hypothetical protein